MADKLVLDDDSEQTDELEILSQPKNFHELLEAEGVTDFQRVIHLGSLELTVQRLCEIGKKFKTDKTAM